LVILMGVAKLYPFYACEKSVLNEVLSWIGNESRTITTPKFPAIIQSTLCRLSKIFSEVKIMLDILNVVLAVIGTIAAIVGTVIVILAYIDGKKTGNSQTNNDNRQTGNDASPHKNVLRISLGKFVIFLLLITGVLLFCLFPLHRDVVVSQLGPNFITKSESESDKRNMVLVENSEYLFQQKLNAVPNKVESIKITITAGLWSQAEETAVFKLKVENSRKSCEQAELFSISRQIPQKSPQNYLDKSLMESTNGIIEWNCSEPPSTLEVEVNPGSWAVSVWSIKVSATYKISVCRSVFDFFI
jgi:hypothetical protein